MIIQLDLIILFFVFVTAIVALSVKNLLTAIMSLSAYSFFMCLMWMNLGAVDVAFTEAAVGAGVSTLVMVAALKQTSRRTKD